MYSNDQSSKSATYVDMLFDSLLKVMNTEKKKINSIHSTRLQLKKEFKKNLITQFKPSCESAFFKKISPIIRNHNKNNYLI